MRVRKISRVLVFIIGGLILLLSLLPRLPEPPGDFRYSDKIGHFLAYLGLGFLIALSSWAATPRRNFLLAFLIALVFGGMIEGLQGLTGRNPELLDQLANSLGGAAGGAAAVLIQVRRSAGK